MTSKKLFKGDCAVNIKYNRTIIKLWQLCCSSFKIVIKSSTFTIDYEYYLRHVCARAIIGKNIVCQAQIKRKRKTSLSLVILYLRIKKIARGIVWVA